MHNIRSYTISNEERKKRRLTAPAACKRTLSVAEESMKSTRNHLNWYRIKINTLLFRGISLVPSQHVDGSALKHVTARPLTSRLCQYVSLLQ